MSTFADTFPISIKDLKKWCEENISGKYIGEIFAYPSTEAPEGAKLLNGQVLTNCDTSYPLFWDWINKNGSMAVAHIVTKPWTMPSLTADGTIGGANYAVEPSKTCASGFEAYKSFDNIAGGSKTYAGIASTKEGSLTYYSPSVLQINRIVFQNQTNAAAANMPTVITISGSNDNIDWDDILSVTYVSQTAGATQSVEIPTDTYNRNNTGYKYYKFHSVNNGGTNTDFPEIFLYGEEYLHTEYVLPENGKVLIFPDDTTYESELTRCGVVGGFVLDNTNKQVRLPSLCSGVLWGGADGDIGRALEAGLPNIEGDWRQGGVNYATIQVDGEANGAFYKKGSVAANTPSFGSTDGYTLGFDASHSNSTYGNSDTVQPPAIQVSFCIQVTGRKIEVNDDGSVDVISALDNKADRTLANVSRLSSSVFNRIAPSNIDYITSYTDDGFNFVRKFASGWVEMGGYLATASANSQHTITLPVEMSDTNYNLYVSSAHRASVDDKWDYGTVGGVIVSSTQIKLSRGRGGGAIFWEVKGFMKTGSGSGSGSTGPADMTLSGTSTYPIMRCYIGTEFTLQFDFKSVSGEYDDYIVYRIKQGILPSGITLQGDKLVGIPTDANLTGEPTIIECYVQLPTVDGEEPSEPTEMYEITIAGWEVTEVPKEVFQEHINDTECHVTATDKSNWDSKADASHTHTTSQITDFATKLATKADASHVSNTTVHITAAERIKWNSYTASDTAATVQSNLDAHTTNTSVHVTSTDKLNWNKKVDASHVGDSSHITAAERTKWNSYTSPDSAVAEVQDNLDAHTTNTSVHVTSTDKSNWNNKADADHTHTTAQISDFTTKLSTKADKSHSHTQSQITGLTSALASKADINHTHSIYAIPDITRSVRIGVNDFTHSTGDWFVTNHATILSGGLSFHCPKIGSRSEYIHDSNEKLDGVVLQALGSDTHITNLRNGVPFVLEILQPCFIAICQIDPANRDDDTDCGVVVGTSREGVCAYRYLYASTYSFTKNLASMNTGLADDGYEPLEECKDIYLDCQFSPQVGVRWMPLMPGTWVRPGVFGGDSKENLQYWTAVICPFYGYDGDPVVAKRHLFCARYEQSGYNSVNDMWFGKQIESYERVDTNDNVLGTGSNKLSVLTLRKFGSDGSITYPSIGQLVNVEVPD